MSEIIYEINYQDLYIKSKLIIPEICGCDLWNGQSRHSSRSIYHFELIKNFSYLNGTLFTI